MRKSHFPFFFLIVLLILSVLPFQINEVNAQEGEWVSPTGFEDPDSEWTTEEKLYDEDTNTYAKETYIPTDSWSSFIFLTHSAITSDKVRFWAYFSISNINKSDVDVSSDGENWTDVYEGVFADREWVEKTFTQQSVIKARIRFYNDSPLAVSEYFYEFDFWEVGIEGESYFIDLTKTFSATFSMVHQTNYNLPLTFTPTTTFTLGTACNFIVNFAFQPSVSFTLNIFYKAFEGFAYIVNLMFSPVVIFTEAFQTNFNVISDFTPSITFINRLQTTYQILFNFAPTVTFTSKAMGNYFVNCIFQPSVTFTLDVIHTIFAGVHYYVDLIFTPIVNFSLNVMSVFPYGISDAITLAVIGFILAIIGICLALVYRYRD